MDLGAISMMLKLNIDNFSSNLKTAEEKIKDTESKFSGFKDVSKRFSDVGKDLTTSLTLPIVGAGVAAVKLASDMESNMAKISTVADTTKTSIESLRKGVVNLSSQTGEATDTISEGLYEAISSGVETSKAMDFMSIAVKSAKAGFTDTRTAVDGLTTTLNSYGKSADEAGKIANQMMVSQNLGKTTFGEMASSLGNVTPIASALGIKTEELFSSLTVLTANGIKTSEAITGLKAAFSNIIKPSTEAQKAADALGIAFNSAEVKSKGWKGFLGDIKVKLKEVAPEYAKATEEQARLGVQLEAMSKSGNKNSDAMKKLKQEYKEAKDKTDALKTASSSQLSAFGTMFGSVEALNTVLTLSSDQGMKLYSESMNQMGSSTDKVGEAFDKVNNTTGANMEKLKQQFKNTLAEIGTNLLPMVNEMLKHISALVKGFNDMSPAGQKVVISILGITAVVGPAIFLFGSFMGSITSIATGFKTLKEVTALFKLTSVAGEGTKVIGVFTKLKGALSLTSIVGFVTNPATLIVAAIAGIIFIGYEIIKNWDTIKKNAKEVWGNIKESTNKNTESMYSMSGGNVRGLSTDTQKYWQDVWKSSKEKWEDIKKHVTTNTDSMYSMSGGHVRNFSSDVSKTWDEIKTSTHTKLGQLSKTITEDFSGTIKFFKDLPHNAYVWGSDFVDGLAKGIRSKIAYAKNAVKDLASGIKSLIHFSRPDEGPLRDYEIYMPHFIEGLTKGVTDNKSMLINSIKAMAQDMSIASRVSLMPATNTGYANSIKTSESNNSSVSYDSLLKVENLYVRNDSDIDKISRAIYNENVKVTRGLGKRG